MAQKLNLVQQVNFYITNNNITISLLILYIKHQLQFNYIKVYRNNPKLLTNPIC